MKRAFILGFAGFMVVFLGLMTYMPFFPTQLETDIPGLIITAMGVVIGLAGLQRGRKLGKSKLGKLGLTLGTILTVIFAGFNFFWVLHMSADLPKPPVVATESVILFEAKDINGEDVGSSALQGKPYVLLFYRGSW